MTLNNVDNYFIWLSFNDTEKNTLIIGLNIRKNIK